MRSITDYALIAILQMNDTQKRQLEVIQHQYAKLEVQTPLKTTVETTLKQAKLETMEKRAMTL
eukprot:Awhi_evm1s11076